MAESSLSINWRTAVLLFIFGGLAFAYGEYRYRAVETRFNTIESSLVARFGILQDRLVALEALVEQENSRRDDVGADSTRLEAIEAQLDALAQQTALIADQLSQPATRLEPGPETQDSVTLTQEPE